MRHGETKFLTNNNNFFLQNFCLLLVGMMKNLRRWLSKDWEKKWKKKKKKKSSGAYSVKAHALKNVRMTLVESKSW